MSFNERLKELRLMSAFTQKDISSALGVSPRTFQQWEHGDREPRISQLIAIANFFNVTTDYLLGVSDAPMWRNTL